MENIENNKKYKILIVEDEILISLNYKKFLEQEGYLIDIVKNANEALEKIHNGVKYDLIITDLEMPKWDGTYVISGLYSKLKDLKIIVVSGCVNDPQYNVIISNFPNVCATIEKPIDLHKLSELIKKILYEK
ncbi:MAG TPA: response regulator [bacterium]|nr:response regulator [bacterium]HPP86882.1 response regulator [bacterium]